MVGLFFLVCVCVCVFFWGRGAVVGVASSVIFLGGAAFCFAFRVGMVMFQLADFFETPA